MGTHLIFGQHPQRSMPLNSLATYSRVGSVVAIIATVAKWVFDRAAVVRSFDRIEQGRTYDREEA
jgi:hypothetical protein